MVLGHYQAGGGPQRGVYYHLYVMIDIFSRCAVHSEVHATELGELAKDFITEAVRLNGGTAPLAIHADRGTSMTSKPVSALLSDLAILKSHSRPKVSNDNPYSEAQFRTLKYCPAFPGTFGSLQDARAFCGVFFTYYNHEHRHSGIGLHTPYSVHIGTAAAIQDQRQAVLNAACAANPRRFPAAPGRPRCPARPGSTSRSLTATLRSCPVSADRPRFESLTWGEEFPMARGSVAAARFAGFGRRRELTCVSEDCSGGVLYYPP